MNFHVLSSCKKSHFSRNCTTQSSSELSLRQNSHNHRHVNGQRSLHQSTVLSPMACRRIAQSHEDVRNCTSSSTAPIPILPSQPSQDENQTASEMNYYNEKSWVMFYRIRRHRASIQWKNPKLSSLKKTEDIDEIFQDRLGRSDSCESLDCSMFPFPMD